MDQNTRTPRVLLMAVVVVEVRVVVVDGGGNGGVAAVAAVCVTVTMVAAIVLMIMMVVGWQYGVCVVVVMCGGETVRRQLAPRLLFAQRLALTRGARSHHPQGGLAGGGPGSPSGSGASHEALYPVALHPIMLTRST